MDWLAFGLSALCALGSFIGFLLSQREKKEAKKSEIAAKEYAENANKANIEIQRYTQHMNTEVDKQQEFDSEKDKIKRYILEYEKDKQHVTCGIKQVFQDIYHGMGDKHTLLLILKALEVDGLITEVHYIGSSEDFDFFSVNRDY